MNIDDLNLEGSNSVLRMLLAKCAEMPVEAWVFPLCCITSQICSEYSHHESENFLNIEIEGAVGEVQCCRAS
jgi:hypothetical protein